MKNKQNLLDAFMLLLLIAASLMLAWSAYSFGGVDFNVYYAAARVTLHGGNPYDYTQLASEIMTVTKINNPYYYAPWFTWGMVPFALLPYQIARALWATLNLALWFFGLIHLQKIVGWPPAGWMRWVMYLFATVLFAWTTWGFEQVGILIFFLLTLTLRALINKRWNLAGIWMALLLFKPNITGLVVAAILLWLILKKNWRPAIVAGAMVLAMFVFSLVVTPHWYEALLQPDKLTGLSYKFGEAGAAALIRHNTTLKDWLAAYHVTGATATLIYGIVVVLGLGSLGWNIVRSNSLPQVTAVALLVTFAITPYALYYDYPALTLTLFFANDITFRHPWLKWGQILLNGLVLASLFVGTTISYRFWTTIAIAALMTFRHFAEHPGKTGTRVSSLD